VDRTLAAHHATGGIESSTFVGDSVGSTMKTRHKPSQLSLVRFPNWGPVPASLPMHSRYGPSGGKRAAIPRDRASRAGMTQRSHYRDHPVSFKIRLL